MESLAGVEDDRLMKLWEGLGYYNRARNLKKTAQLVTKQYGGSLPGDYEILLKLPGIGSYTAGAVASIAYDIPVPAVDGQCASGVGQTFSYRRRYFEAVRKAQGGAGIPCRYAEGKSRRVQSGADGAWSHRLRSQRSCEMRGLPSGLPVPRQGRRPCGGISEKVRKETKENREQDSVCHLSGDKTAIGQRPGKGLLAGCMRCPTPKGILLPMRP